MARVMSITTPLGDGALLFYSMTATEALGRLFEYDITLLSVEARPEGRGSARQERHGEARAA